jgi:hypothetical protein
MHGAEVYLVARPEDQTDAAELKLTLGSIRDHELHAL